MPWLAAHTIAEVKERFAELNIACAKVLTVPELESNPQYVARESITQWQTMDGRTCKGPNIMPKFKNNPGQIWRGMPSHGMDTAAIFEKISATAKTTFRSWSAKVWPKLRTKRVASVGLPD